MFLVMQRGRGIFLSWRFYCCIKKIDPSSRSYLQDIFVGSKTGTSTFFESILEYKCNFFMWMMLYGWSRCNGPKCKKILTLRSWNIDESTPVQKIILQEIGLIFIKNIDPVFSNFYLNECPYYYKTQKIRFFLNRIIQILKRPAFTS